MDEVSKIYIQGGLYTRGAYTWTIFCVYKQVGHKQVSHKQENKHVLSSVTGLILIWGTYIRCMCVCVLYSGGLYLECGERLHMWWAYTWGGLIFGGGLIVGGLRYNPCNLYQAVP
jgi:hypothetical protein